MRTKRFTASLAPYNNVKIFEAETGNLLKVIKVDGTITTQPVVEDSKLTLEVQKENLLYKNVYTLPQGILKSSDSL